MEPRADSLKLTYEDFLYFPEDGKRHELIDGEHYVAAAPNLKHQTAVANLVSRLVVFVHPKKLGRIWPSPVDVLLSEHDVVEPDVVFLSNERMDLAADGAKIVGAPDLLVEVLSPRTCRTDAVTKRHLYEKYGVREYWMVDPELETVEVYRLRDGRFRRDAELSAERGDVLKSPLFPGLKIAVAEVFA